MELLFCFNFMMVIMYQYDVKHVDMYLNIESNRSLLRQCHIVGLTFDMTDRVEERTKNIGHNTIC